MKLPRLKRANRRRCYFGLRGLARGAMAACLNVLASAALTPWHPLYLGPVAPAFPLAVARFAPMYAARIPRIFDASTHSAHWHNTYVSRTYYIHIHICRAVPANSPDSQHSMAHMLHNSLIFHDNIMKFMIFSSPAITQTAKQFIITLQTVTFTMLYGMFAYFLHTLTHNYVVCNSVTTFLSCMTHTCSYELISPCFHVTCNWFARNY